MRFRRSRGESYNTSPGQWGLVRKGKNRALDCNNLTYREREMESKGEYNMQEGIKEEGKELEFRDWGMQKLNKVLERTG